MTKHYDEALLKADFRNFLYIVWEFLGLPEPTKVQYDIAYYLQYGPKRSIIMGYRGVGKSWITAAFVCWLLYCNPQTKILVVSASKDRSDNFSIFTKRLINDMPLLKGLRAKHGQRDSNVAFDVGLAKPDHAPSVKSVGITGQLTGSRADVIVADDIEVPKNSLTQTMRDRLSEAVKEFDANLKPDDHCAIKYLGTPQTEMSVYNTLAERGYEIRIWPTRYPKPKQQSMYGAKLAPVIVDALALDPSLADSPHHERYGQPVDPGRFDERDLLDREASYGRSGFALQFMLDTTISDGDRYPLKLSDLIVMGLNDDLAPIKVAWGSGTDQVINNLPTVGLAGDRLHAPIFVHEDFKSYAGSVMWIDPSGRGKDETAFCVIKMLNGFLYLKRIGGFLSGYDESTLTALAKIAKDNKVNYIGVEDNFGDGMFIELFKPYLTRTHPCTIEGDSVHGMKEARIIDTLEPVMNQHRLVVDEKVFRDDFQNAPSEKYQLFYQMTRMTKEKGALGQDDRIDVLAQAVGYCIDQMDIDTDSIEGRWEEEERDRTLQEFMDNCFPGQYNTNTNWLSNS